jgi:deuterolysin
MLDNAKHVVINLLSLLFDCSYINHSLLRICKLIRLQPGETFTTSVNAAKTYNLAGVAEAKVTALQGFKYVTGTTAPTSLKEMEFCQAVSSGTVSVVPDQSKVAA